MERTEAEIQKDILRYLALVNIPAFRINVGMIPNGRGGFRKSLMTGMSDILAIGAGGRFVAIEVKRPGKKATEAQQQFLDRVEIAGGLAMVATCTKDVEDALKLNGLAGVITEPTSWRGHGRV